MITENNTIIVSTSLLSRISNKKYALKADHIFAYKLFFLFSIVAQVVTGAWTLVNYQPLVAISLVVLNQVIMFQYFLQKVEIRDGQSASNSVINICAKLLSLGNVGLIAISIWAIVATDYL